MLQDFAHAVQGLVRDLGYPGLFLLIVAESTMIPIPSLLVMPFAGFMASQGDFSLPVILVINSVAALLGSALSYWIGAAGGKPLLLKYGKYVFVRPKDLEKTEAYFAAHGKWTVLIARFLPVVRHIISIPAGIARMPLIPFFTQTFIGSTLWGGGLMILGYELGTRWESIATKAKRVDLVIAVVVVLALVGVGIGFIVRRRRERANNPDRTSI
ncbi:MAG: putative rane-associated protein [Myxococcales bacterium]|nr:putative rane-associated protein [Myxococcales bacterium]